MKKSLTQLANEGLHFPNRFIKGRRLKPTKLLVDLAFGEGAIVDVNGKKVAAFKDEAGKVITLSPVCRHLGCIVAWNSADKTWDCPCHGSRYEAWGTLKQGPAKLNLKPANLK